MPAPRCSDSAGERRSSVRPFSTNERAPRGRTDTSEPKQALKRCGCRLFSQALPGPDRAAPSGACTRFCGGWLDCNGRSHGIACFEVRSDFRFGLAFPFFRLGEPKETSGRIAHCELAKLRL